MRFGSFQLDEESGELRRDGELVKLPPRQFRLLQLLAKNPGRVVPREEIQKEIWGPDTYVDFQRNLNVCIAQIRAALEDDPDSPRFIQTVPRKGYRFIGAPAPVTPVEPAHASAKHGTRWIRIAAASIVVIACCVGAARLALRAALPPAIRLAVLPFQSLNHDPSDEPLLDGLTTELIASLGTQDERLNVLGRSSVIWATRRSDPSVIARDLRADYVIEGTLRREDSRLRLTMSLTRVMDHVQVWTETIERDSSNSFELQEDVAARVTAGALRALFPESKAVARPLRGASQSAYQAYLDGRFLEHQGNRDGLQRSIAYFQRAVQESPEFAPAHAALAEAYVSLSLAGGTSSFENAKTAAQDALRIDDANVEAHNALGDALFWHDWDWSGAEREFRAATTANPSFALAYHDEAFLLVATGRRDGALTLLRRAMVLEPLSVRVNMDAGWLLLQAHRFDESIAQAKRAMELQPGLREAEACIVRAKMYQGQSVQTPETSDAFLKAAYESLRGNRDAALASLEKAYSDHRPMMVFLKSEPAFERLHNEPRFQALVAKMRFP